MAHARKATREDALALAPRLRPVDVKEVRVLTGMDPLTSLLNGVKHDARAIVADDGETVIGMFGVTPTKLPGVGAAWLLATEELVNKRSHTRQFLRECRAWTWWLHTKYPVIGNTILDENRVAIRWLRWLGFEFYEHTPIVGAAMFMKTHAIVPQEVAA